MLTKVSPTATTTAELISAEQILDAIRNYVLVAIEKKIIKLVASEEGKERLDSTINEDVIAVSLRGFAEAHPFFTDMGLSIEVAPKGFWYDLLVHSADESIWLPINVKVSSLEGNDDISSKGGVFYTLTGIRPTGSTNNNWENFCRNMASLVNRGHCSANYYFLVVQKSTPARPVGQVFWTSLLQLQRVIPNGSNPPFQCRWKDNMVRATRTRNEAIDYLLDVVGETFIQRAKPLKSFTTHLVPLFSGTLAAKWSKFVDEAA